MRTVKLSADQKVVLQLLIENAPPNGYSLGEVRIGIRILDRLPEDGDLLLEEAEWSFLKNRMETTQWKMASRDILALVDSVMEAKSGTK